jgi:hypothetical protein
MPNYLNLLCAQYIFNLGYLLYLLYPDPPDQFINEA